MRSVCSCIDRRELVSTLQLTEPVARSKDALAYASNTAIIIWDIQTGGVAKELKYNGHCIILLVWSLNGGGNGLALGGAHHRVQI